MAREKAWQNVIPISDLEKVTINSMKSAFLHFDAHTDAFEQIPHFLGAKKSAAHWAAYLVRQGLIDTSKSVQIGMRGNPRTLDWWKTSSDCPRKSIWTIS